MDIIKYVKLAEPYEISIHISNQLLSDNEFVEIEMRDVNNNRCIGARIAKEYLCDSITDAVVIRIKEMKKALDYYSRNIEGDRNGS